MISRTLAFVVTLTLISAGSVRAEGVSPGDYICTVHEKAGIGSIHIEGAPPPKSFISELRNRFTIKIEAPTGTEPKFRIVETPYAGPDRDPRDWHTENSVLHGDYVGDGYDFTALDDHAFLRIGTPNTGGLWFYHAGFEYPGGVDVKLSVRFGVCEEREPGGHMNDQ